MKHLAIFLFSMIALNFFSKAQNDVSDTISIEKKMLGADFSYKGKDLSLIKLEDICQLYPDAKDEIDQAKRNSNPAIILTLVGAGLIGYTGFKWLMGDNPQWYFAAGGAVLIGATIPLYIGKRNHSINAARIYNYELKHKHHPKK
jgi:hypothetical protein